MRSTITGFTSCWSQRVFFYIYQSQSTGNYTTIWLSICIQRSKSALVRLVTQFMMVDTRIVHKLRLYSRFQFDFYRDGGMGAYLKVHKHPPTKLLQRSRKVQFTNILID